MKKILGKEGMNLREKSKTYLVVAFISQKAIVQLLSRGQVIGCWKHWASIGATGSQ